MCENAAQIVLVGASVRVRGVGSRSTHGTVQRREHPPDGPAIRDRLDDGPARLQARSQRGELGEGDVGAFQLPGRGEYMRCELGELVLRDVDDGEDVERPERGLQAVRLGEGGDRVSTGDEQRADVPRLDLVGERNRRDLPEDSGKLRPAPRWRRSRGRRSGCSPAQAVDAAAMEIHTGRAIERTGRDEDDPAQPLREDAVARHRHPGTAVHREPTRVRAHFGDELLEQRPVDVGRGRGAFDCERAERGPQRGDLVRVAMRAQLVLVGAALDQRVCQRAEHRDVGARQHRYVYVGARRGLGPAGIEHPHPPAAGAVLAQIADRIRERGAIAMGDDRVGTDEDRQTRDGRVPHRVQHRLAGDELRRNERGRVVDGDRGDERATPDRRKPLARRDLPGGVIRETRGEVEPDCVGTVRVDDEIETRREVGEQFLPRHFAAAHTRAVEAAGRVMPRGQTPPLRAHVPARNRMVVVAAHPQHLIAVDRYDNAARGGADPAVRERFARHAQEPGVFVITAVARHG